MADLNEIIGAIGAGIAATGITMVAPPAVQRGVTMAPIITPGQPVPFDPRQLGFIFP